MGRESTFGPINTGRLFPDTQSSRDPLIPLSTPTLPWNERQVFLGSLSSNQG